jgi:hypothetical protein
MRNSIIFAGMLLLAASCSNENESVEQFIDNQAFAPVTIRVSDFSMSFENLTSTTQTRSTDVASYNGLKVITLAFYSGDTKVYESTQLRSDETTYTTFGHFSCNLPIGSYKMVVIGRDLSDGDIFTLTSPTEAAYTSEKVRETFSAVQDVTISNSSAQNLTVTLSRVVSMLKIVSNDNRTAEAAQIKTTFSAGGKSFNPSTGLATSNEGFGVINHPSTAVGATISVFSYAFLTTDEQEMDITLEIQDEDGNTLFTKFIPNVILKRNRKTTLTGPVFTPTSVTNSSFSVDTDWLDELFVTF